LTGPEPGRWIFRSYSNFHDTAGGINLGAYSGDAGLYVCPWEGGGGNYRALPEGQITEVALVHIKPNLRPAGFNKAQETARPDWSACLGDNLGDGAGEGGADDGNLHLLPGDLKGRLSLTDALTGNAQLFFVRAGFNGAKLGLGGGTSGAGCVQEGLGGAYGLLCGRNLGLGRAVFGFSLVHRLLSDGTLSQEYALTLQGGSGQVTPGLSLANGGARPFELGGGLVYPCVRLADTGTRGFDLGWAGSRGDLIELGPGGGEGLLGLADLGFGDLVADTGQYLTFGHDAALADQELINDAGHLGAHCSLQLSAHLT
jgi:hypothetical protein